MTLGQKQRLFTKMVGQLIQWSYANGYELSVGEAERSVTQAVANARSGTGIKNSLHLIRLAIDLNLFVNGVYQRDSAAYEPLGEYWESLGGTWGGRFKKPDGNHFSMTHNGIS